MVQAGTNRDVLEGLIADWRRQLEGIPPETRDVKGLEAYLAEVERVGRRAGELEADEALGRAVGAARAGRLDGLHFLLAVAIYQHGRSAKSSAFARDPR